MTDERAAQWIVDGVVGGGAVAADDRGLAYGDGVFETMSAQDGHVRLLDYHLERLTAGCDQLGIVRPDAGAVAAEIAAQLAGRRGRAVVKLVVTRGSGGRGYAPPAHAEPRRVLGIFPWPEHDPAHYTHGIVLRTSTITIGENERLAGLKHLCRLEQVIASMALPADADEGLQLSTSGNVVGGISSNLFTVSGGRVRTPAVVKCGVRGVMRRVVLEACAREGLPVDEADLGDADLRAADELFVTNAVRGVVPVRVLDGRAYAVGPITRRLQRTAHADG